MQNQLKIGDKVRSLNYSATFNIIYFFKGIDDCELVLFAGDDSSLAPTTAYLTRCAQTDEGLKGLLQQFKDRVELCDFDELETVIDPQWYEVVEN